MTQYREGGLAALLAVYVPAGKRPALTPAQLAQLQQRLQQPNGFASYGEIQQWIATSLGVKMGYHAVHTQVHDKMQARPKVARPSHKKSPEIVSSFQMSFAARLAAELPPERTKPVELWAYDESGLGLHTIRRQRITARGTKPVEQLQQRLANCYLYGAIAPASGDDYFLGLPKFNAEHFQRFLDEFARARPDTLNVLLLDNSRCHTAQELRIPENIVLLFQEPYAPELNPAEQVWVHLKTALVWRCVANLEALQAEVVRLVTAYDAATLHSLTAYPYIMHGINEIAHKKGKVLARRTTQPKSLSQNGCPSFESTSD